MLNMTEGDTIVFSVIGRLYI